MKCNMYILVQGNDEMSLCLWGPHHQQNCTSLPILRYVYFYLVIIVVLDLEGFLFCVLGFPFFPFISHFFHVPNFDVVYEINVSTLNPQFI